MVKYAGVDHFAMKTNDMEGTVRFYHDILGLKLVLAFKTGSEVVNKNVRHYFFDAGNGNHIAFFDGAQLPGEGVPQRFDHLALTVLSEKDFQAAYTRLKEHGIKVTNVVELGGTRDPFGGKTFYFHDPNGIRMQIMLRTEPLVPFLTGDPDPVPSVRRIAGESAGGKPEASG